MILPMVACNTIQVKFYTVTVFRNTVNQFGQCNPIIGIDGRFATFNYGLSGTPSTYTHLRNQNYRICIRQEEGYCCVTYMKCTSGSYQFSLNTGASATFALAKQGTDCSEDYVGIEGNFSFG